MSDPSWTPAPFAVYVEGTDNSRPYRFRIGAAHTMLGAKKLIADNERAVGPRNAVTALTGLKPDPKRRYRIFEASGWREHP